MVVFQKRGTSICRPQNTIILIKGPQSGIPATLILGNPIVRDNLKLVEYGAKFLRNNSDSSSSSSNNNNNHRIVLIRIVL